LRQVSLGYLNCLIGKVQLATLPTSVLLIIVATSWALRGHSLLPCTPTAAHVTDPGPGTSSTTRPTRSGRCSSKPRPGADARPLSAAKAKVEARRAAAGRRDGAGEGRWKRCSSPGCIRREFADGLVAGSRLDPDAYERLLRRTACELAGGGTVELADGFFAPGCLERLVAAVALPVRCKYVREDDTVSARQV